MKKFPLKQEGFGLVGALIVIAILVVLGGTGAYVYRRNHKPKATTSSNHSTQTTSNTSSKTNSSSSTSTKTDPYAGWKTYTLTSVGLSVRYPADWTVPAGGMDSTGFEIHSPVRDGYYFTVDLAIGTGQNINQNFLGSGPGSTLLNLNVPASKQPLYLVAQSAGPNGQVTGLALATTAGSAKTSFGIPNADGRGNDLVMWSNLIPAGSGSGVNNPYSFQTYQQQVDYQTVLSIFKSLSYN